MSIRSVVKFLKKNMLIKKDELQHFNFDVLHIDGKDNVEADTLSRLVPFPSKETSSLNINNLDPAEMIEPRQYQSKKIFKKIQEAHNR